MSEETNEAPQMGLAELMTRIGDEKLRFQRLGHGHFKANVTTKETSISFKTSREIGLEVGAGDAIGFVVWMKRSDVDQAQAAYKKCLVTNPDTPLGVAVEDGQLVIRIGIERLDGHNDHPEIPELPIINHQQWAKDVAYELERDRGDGATPISLCIEKAMREAVDNGSSGLMFPRKKDQAKG